MKQWLYFFILLISVASSAMASPLLEKVQEHRFDNGIRLLVVERHSSPIFSAYITIGVGAVDETDSTRGVAHLLEHMLFKGTKSLGTRDFAAEKPILAEIEQVGSEIDRLKLSPEKFEDKLKQLRSRLQALQGQHAQLVVKDEFSKIYSENGGVGYNAFTSKDLTSYLISLPSNKLELWAALESDRMANPVLREFYTEREVIREERRRSYDTRPGGKLYETLLANAFTVHPYRNPIIGWDSDIANLTLEETRSFLNAYYSPANTVIALVGDVDFAQAVSLVEKYFADLPAGIKVPPLAVVEPPQSGEKRINVEFDAEPQLAMAYHKPTLPAREDYLFDLLDGVLTGGRTSRLYQSLVLEKKLATGVNTFSAPGSRFANLYVIQATPRFPHTPEEVVAAVDEELAALRKDPISPEEYQRVINRLQADHLRHMKTNGGLARMLTYFQTVAGDWRYLVDYDERMRSLQVDELQELVQTYLNPGQRTLVVLQRGEG